LHEAGWLKASSMRTRVLGTSDLRPVFCRHWGARRGPVGGHAVGGQRPYQGLREVPEASTVAALLGSSSEPTRWARGSCHVYPPNAALGVGWQLSAGREVGGCRRRGDGGMRDETAVFRLELVRSDAAGRSCPGRRSFGN
jgi:hypothetical protein